MLGGVCAALAQRFGWNKWLVRLAAVLSIVIPGPQLLGYVGFWILMPEEVRRRASSAGLEALVVAAGLKT